MGGDPLQDQYSLCYNSVSKVSGHSKRGTPLDSTSLQSYLKNNPRFGILINPISPNLDGAASKIDKVLFENIYPDVVEDKASGFTQENIVEGMCYWAYVDSALNADECNGRSSTEHMIHHCDMQVNDSRFS